MYRKHDPFLALPSPEASRHSVPPGVVPWLPPKEEEKNATARGGGGVAAEAEGVCVGSIHQNQRRGER